MTGARSERRRIPPLPLCAFTGANNDNTPGLTSDTSFHLSTVCFVSHCPCFFLGSFLIPTLRDDETSPPLFPFLEMTLSNAQRYTDHNDDERDGNNKIQCA